MTIFVDFIPHNWNKQPCLSVPSLNTRGHCGCEHQTLHYDLNDIYCYLYISNQLHRTGTIPIRRLLPDFIPNKVIVFVSMDYYHFYKEWLELRSCDCFHGHFLSRDTAWVTQWCPQVKHKPTRLNHSSIQIQVSLALKV